MYTLVFVYGPWPLSCPVNAAVSECESLSAAVDIVVLFSMKALKGNELNLYI